MANSSLFDTGHGIGFSMAAGMEGGKVGDEGRDPGDEGCDLGDEGCNPGDEGHNADDEGCNPGDKGYNLGSEASNLGTEQGGAIVDNHKAGIGEDETAMGDVSAGMSRPVLDNVTNRLDSRTGWVIRAFVTTGGLGSNADLCRMVWPFNQQAGVLGMMI